jgi:hypothetical protein
MSAGKIVKMGISENGKSLFFHFENGLIGRIESFCLELCCHCTALSVIDLILLFLSEGRKVKPNAINPKDVSVEPNRDRGWPHGRSPPTPPGIRITYQGGSVGLIGH